MAFSIFNKSGQDGKSSNDPTKTTVKSPEASDPTKTLVKSPAAAAKPDGNETATTFPATSTATASTVMRPGGPPQNEMMAYDIEEVPQLQEAAALYAADHLDAAQSLLSKAVQDKSGNAQAWLMLLDLYKIRNLKKEFEDLAMTYTVKFERSPPTWNQETPQAEARKEARPNSDFFNFQGKDGLLQDILKFTEFANRLGSARTDLAKIKAITSDEADALAKTLLDLRKRNVPIRFNNVTTLIDMLKKIIGENPSKDFLGAWALLFELYQREGRQSEFEDLGLEYAMGFEMSPPSWEAVPVQAPSADAEQANETEAPATLQGYPLRGSVSLENVAHVQQQLIHHGASNREVHINMAALQRIDFSAAGIFADTFSKLASAGKKIVLIDVNELIFPLLEAFGVHRVAVLLRRKAQ